MTSFSDKRVFLVEDDPHNLSITMSFLKKMGIQVFYDRWGIDTIERMVKALPLDLIFLDLHFPHGVTGYIIFEKMQAKPNLKNIPTVILSASDPDIEIKKAQSMGFSGFISRPIRRESFERQLKRIFSGGTVWGDYPF